jgi:hypothetical protein
MKTKYLLAILIFGGKASGAVRPEKLERKVCPGTAILVMSGGGQLWKQCLYRTNGLVAYQKVPGGYLVTINPAWVKAGLGCGTHGCIAFLATKQSLSEGKAPHAPFVYWAGNYHFTAISGFEESVLAFGEYKGPKPDVLPDPDGDAIWGHQQ